MIALDTNVLVRFVVEDEEASSRKQTRRARKLVEDAIARGDTIFIPDIVLCEFVWVLRSAYGVDLGTIRSTLDNLLDTSQFVFQSPDAVRAAAGAFRQGPADFADYLILDRALNAGCETLFTFDRKLAQSEHAQVPDP